MKDIIGILDSGVGGISVLRRAVQLLPNENFLFYGDNANAPYGRRPLEEIRTLSRQATDYLLEKDVKALVIACNTITSAYAETLRAEVSIPVIGMEPAVKPASLARSGGKILALATRATLSLERFSRLMEHYGEGVIPLEGKGLVEIVDPGAPIPRRPGRRWEPSLSPISTSRSTPSCWAAPTTPSCGGRSSPSSRRRRSSTAWTAPRAS